LPIRNRRSRTE
jgi:hypothetical protein